MLIYRFVMWLCVCLSVCLGVFLTEEERLAVFEIILLLRVFGCKRELDAGDWAGKNLDEEELHVWHVSPKTGSSKEGERDKQGT